MRDNRHTLMSILQKIADAGYFTFLATFLELEYAEHEVEFVNLRVENYITKFDQIRDSPRHTKYVEKQKARRCRVAFESLRDYFRKESRNSYVITTEQIESEIASVLDILKRSSSEIKSLDTKISELLSGISKDSLEEGFPAIVKSIPKNYPQNFSDARNKMVEIMQLVAVELSNQWNSERYVRGQLNLDS